jgi:NADH:ubiquinone oxidoreductase subunit C
MGLFFQNHDDLRRILTDYGFKYFPLRKDYPIFGYVEIKYNDYNNKLIFVPVELSQEFRVFEFKSP